MEKLENDLKVMNQKYSDASEYQSKVFTYLEIKNHNLHVHMNDQHININKSNKIRYVHNKNDSNDKT